MVTENLQREVRLFLYVDYKYFLLFLPLDTIIQHFNVFAHFFMFNCFPPPQLNRHFSICQQQTCRNRPLKIPLKQRQTSSNMSLLLCLTMFEVHKTVLSRPIYMIKHHHTKLRQASLNMSLILFKQKCFIVKTTSSCSLEHCQTWVTFENFATCSKNLMMFDHALFIINQVC